MKTQQKNTPKRMYLSPSISSIKLDNEISLALESEPPVGPYESNSNASSDLNNDPFKPNLG